MKKPLKITLIALPCILIASSLFFFKYKKYDYTLNIITSIKYFEPSEKKYAYQLITLTPTEFWSTPFSNTVIAKAVYKDKTIGIKISLDIFGNKITFKSIGEESNNFVKALSELYDENTDDCEIRSKIEGRFMNHGHQSWLKGECCYKATLKDLNGKEADLHLEIDLDNKSVTIGDRHSGINKKNFVNSFKVGQ